ncbi:Uncharacterised protein [Mycobacteroides abscessus subsp. abscessus]|nr:Uncharacterised protein [Mycobacteroides abscessus subsp. abscessus]
MSVAPLSNVHLIQGNVGAVITYSPEPIDSG